MKRILPHRRARVTAALLTTAALVTAGVLAVTSTEAGADNSAAKDLPQPVVNTHDLMSLFNQPLYRYLKQTMQKDLDEQEWKTVTERGWQTAEVANLVALRKPHGDPQQWQAFAAKLQQAGVDLAKTAKTHDVQATREAYRTLIQRCNACHQSVAPDHAPQLTP